MSSFCFNWHRPHIRHLVPVGWFGLLTFIFCHNSMESLLLISPQPCAALGLCHISNPCFSPPAPALLSNEVNNPHTHTHTHTLITQPHLTWPKVHWLIQKGISSLSVRVCVRVCVCVCVCVLISHFGHFIMPVVGITVLIASMSSPWQMHRSTACVCVRALPVSLIPPTSGFIFLNMWINFSHSKKKKKKKNHKWGWISL